MHLLVFENLTLATRNLAPPSIILSVIRRAWIVCRRKTTTSFFAHVAVFRFALKWLTPGQLQLIVPPTVAAYKGWIKKARAAAVKQGDTALARALICDIVGLPDGKSSLLWIGNRAKARKVVLYFHGGGYVVPMKPGHAQFCLESCVKASEDRDVAVAMLQYTLWPAGQYPNQLRQAVAAFKEILNVGFNPEQIVVGGDSAGANLTVQLLLHMVHPHPSVDAVSIHGQRLAGAIAISPWVSDNANTRSFLENEHVDMLTARGVRKSNQDLFGGTTAVAERAKGEGWSLPLDVPAVWLDGMDDVVKRLYVTAGEQEIWRDHGILFAETVRRRNPGLEVTLEVPENEPHDFILVEGESGIVGDATKRMRSWVAQTFGL